MMRRSPSSLASTRRITPRFSRNEACWPKALPALGITFPVENIRGEVNTAKQLASTALSVKRLYFAHSDGRRSILDG